jgi:hypothetical protein
LPPHEFANSSLPPPYEDPINEAPEPVGKWHTSPRWSAVQGNGCIVVDQKPSAQGNIDVEDCPTDEMPGDQPPAGGY